MEMQKGTMAMQTEEATTSVPRTQVELQCAMRKLWEDHIVWTRQVIVSVVAGSPDTDAAVARLLQNPVDLEKLFAEYYGDQTAAAVRDLIKDHLTIAAELVMAAKANDTRMADDAEKRWYANADDIAGALNSFNPIWPKQTVTDMLHNHLRLTKEEAVARLTSNWNQDVRTYDMIHNQALMMADTLTEGMVMQFPGRFKT